MNPGLKKFLEFLEGAFCGGVVGFIAVVVFLGWVFEHNGRDKARREAVQAEVAHWEVDPKTGETTFVWNSPTLKK